MGSKRAKELWQLGVPLSRSWLKFAPPALRSQFEQFPEFLNAISQISEMEIRENPIHHLVSVVQNSTARMRLEKEMKEEVLTDLFNGQLLATAYREFPSRSPSPVIIDPAKFENDDPDWQMETLVAYGFRYGRIRICSPETLPPVHSKPKGSSNAIGDAIDQLIQENSDFCELPRKTACQKIRDYLGAKEIAGNGMSDQNLAKAIVRNCGQKRISAN